MIILQCQEAAFNLVLFKRIGLYRIFDPNSPKMFNCHVYRLAYVTICAITLCINVCGMLGFLTNMEDIVDDMYFFQIICAVTYNSLSVLKVIICMYYANQIWDLFGNTRIHFFTSGRCTTAHIDILQLYRDRSIQITNLIFVLFSMTSIVSLVFPLLFSVYIYMTKCEADEQRYENIFNFRFPVTINTYNDYFYVFYVFETIALSFISYTTIIIDILLISVTCGLIAEYEVLARAFENIGQEQEHQKEIEKHYTEYYDDFQSIIIDQQRLSLKFKTYYSVVWLIVLCNVILTSISIILIVYSIMVYIHLKSSLSIINLIKLVGPFLCLSTELFMCCYLLDHINSKRESVTFGMYCCNWTMMDLKFKKMLLLTMRVFNSNKPIIKVTPKKIINLIFFTNVIMTCYNIISVMLKIRFNIRI